MPPKITIDGQEYDFESLNDTARAQLTNLRACDQEIARTQAMLVMLQTARSAYAQVLKTELPK